MNYPSDDNLPVVDELAAMGFDLGICLEEYIPADKSTLDTQVTRLSNNEDSIIAYRKVHSLALTEMQAKVLGAISDRKIQEASLRDLVGAYKVLKEKEHLVDGKPTEITGLVGYLVQLEKEEKEEKEKEIVINSEDIIEEAV